MGCVSLIKQCKEREKKLTHKIHSLVKENFIFAPSIFMVAVVQ
jgi:hypothetical protein